MTSVVLNALRHYKQPNCSKDFIRGLTISINIHLWILIVWILILHLSEKQKQNHIKLNSLRFSCSQHIVPYGKCDGWLISCSYLLSSLSSSTCDLVFKIFCSDITSPLQRPKGCSPEISTPPFWSTRLFIQEAHILFIHFFTFQK